jgi:hypothetical protein
MTLATVQILGPTYLSRSVQFSSQATVNMYAEVDQAGRNEGAYMPFPGTKAFIGSSGVDRGQYVFKNVLYKVTNNTLYSVSADSVPTSHGTIHGDKRCIFADDGKTMVIVSDGFTYKYDTVLTRFTHEKLVKPKSVAILNNQAIYDTGVGGEFAMADLNAPDTIYSANTAIAESNGDSLVRVYSFGQRIYFFGEETIEPWYNSGVGNPPLDRIDTGIITVGLGALHSVANTDEFVYFLGNDLNIYRITANNAQIVSNPSLAGEIQSYATTSDAIGYTCGFQGQKFYVITFPTEGKTFAFSEAVNDWVILESFGGAHIGNGYSYIYGKHILADRRNGGLVEWDIYTFSDMGSAIIRRRTTKVVCGESIQKPRARLLMRWFELLCQTGLGLPNGQGSDPHVMIEMSFDGGHTFEGKRFIPIGRGGEFTRRVRAYNMDSFYDAVFRVTFSDPIFFSIQGASIDVDLYGY